MSKLSDEQIDRVAEQVALGIPKSAIAEEIGVSERSLTALLQKPKVSAKVEVAKSRVASIVQVSMTKLALGLEDAVENILADVRNPNSKTQLQSSWALIDRVVPKQQQNDVTVHHIVDAQVLADISHSLKTIKPHEPSEDLTSDPHLLSGEAALPKAGEVIELPVAASGDDDDG